MPRSIRARSLTPAGPSRRICGLASDDGLRFGAPAPLFGIVRLDAGGGTSIYDVFPDGERFVVAEAVSAQSEAKLTVALNWMNDLRK